MGKIEVIKTDSGKRRRVYSGTLEACCHTIDFWYDLTGVRNADALTDLLDAEAESRARDCIQIDCWSGELNATEQEISGWWHIHGTQAGE